MAQAPQADLGGWEAQEMPSKAELDAMVAEAVRAGGVRLQEFDAVSVAGLDLRRPGIVRGGAVGWEILSWKHEDLIRKLGDAQVPWRPCFGDVRHPPQGMKPTRSVAEYFSQEGPRPGVLFDQDEPALRAHAMLRDFYDVPPWLAKVHGHRKSTIPMISVAQRNTGVGFHSHAENWLAQIIGRKLWWVIPMGTEYPFGEVTLKQPAPWRYMQPGQIPPGSAFCVLSPGDVLYLPEGCMHATWNIDESCFSIGAIGVREEVTRGQGEEAAPPPSTEVLAVREAYQRGVQLEAVGDLAGAHGVLLEAAEGGHLAAMWRIWCISRRMGGPPESQWLKNAAQLGFAQAQLDLGDSLGGPTAGGSEAAGWYGRAAEQGHPGGQHRMALVKFHSGDLAAGEALMRESAAQGWADAEIELGGAAHRAGAFDEARSWYEKAAGRGHPAAMNQLAIFEAQAGSHEGARVWLQKSAERGHRGAMRNLALYLEQGMGGPADARAAAEWRRRAE